jgi:hypothetical protein
LTAARDDAPLPLKSLDRPARVFPLRLAWGDSAPLIDQGTRSVQRIALLLRIVKAHELRLMNHTFEPVLMNQCAYKHSARSSPLSGSMKACPRDLPCQRARMIESPFRRCRQRWRVRRQNGGRSRIRPPPRRCIATSTWTSDSSRAEMINFGDVGPKVQPAAIHLGPEPGGNTDLD